MALFVGSAQALTIQLFDVGTSPMTAEQLAAFEEAAQIWENRLTDPITVKLNIAWDEPATFSRPSVLASTLSARTTQFWLPTVLAMALDSDSASETSAISQLPGGGIPVLDINGPRTANRVTISTANAKALGLTTTLDPVYGAALANNADAQIRYNNDYLAEFDIDRSDGIDAEQYDFIGVAAHEIGHALGFFSMTDIQDNPSNSDFVLFPSILDVWRFVEAGGSHALNSEDRQVTAAPAEYDDSIIDAFLSWGMGQVEPSCGAATGLCQASHWRDDEGNLMDPTVDTGVLVNPLADDLHAMDYIGYERRLLLVDLLPWLRDMRWLFFARINLGQPPIPIPGGPFPPPPSEEGLQPSENANLGLIANIDFGVNANTGEPIFGGPRTMLGIGEIREAALPAVQEPMRGFDPGPDQFEETEPLRQPMQLMPPALCFLNFISDQEGGMPFSARPRGGQDCVSFDHTLGDFGGWRLPLCLDGLGDNVQDPDDCDALTTLVLLLEEQVNVVTLDSLLNVGMKIDPDLEDNGVVIYDPVAMGMADSDSDAIADVGDNCLSVENADQRDTNGDGYGNLCDADLNNDGAVNFADLGLLKAVFFTTDPDADFNGDGAVNFADLGLMKSMFFQAPGPSGVVP